MGRVNLGIKCYVMFFFRNGKDVGSQCVMLSYVGHLEEFLIMNYVATVVLRNSDTQSSIPEYQYSIHYVHCV